MRPTLFEHAGGAPAILALARAHHRRCLADPELNHPFSHPTLNPDHVPRLAAYWGEVLGGPAEFTARYGSQTSAMRLHACGEDVSPWGPRFVACFVAAMDDAGLPADAEFRAAMQAYVEWATTEFLRVMPGAAADVPDGLRVPRWTWDGLAPSG
jgi:hemoglobin